MQDNARSSTGLTQRFSGAGDRLPHFARLRRERPDGPPTAFDKRDFQLDQKLDTKDARNRIRCPICSWQPQRANRWYCLPMGSPENFTGGCGHAWNTFDTRGRCPSCRYQWRHTTCLRCNATSPHDDWYEKSGKKKA